MSPEAEDTSGDLSRWSSEEIYAKATAPEGALVDPLKGEGATVRIFGVTHGDKQSNMGECAPFAPRPSRICQKGIFTTHQAPTLPDASYTPTPRATPPAASSDVVRPRYVP